MAEANIPCLYSRQTGSWAGEKYSTQRIGATLSTNRMRMDEATIYANQGKPQGIFHFPTLSQRLGKRGKDSDELACGEFCAQSEIVQ
jgi:hypothetical protein